MVILSDTFYLINKAVRVGASGELKWRLTVEMDGIGLGRNMKTCWSFAVPGCCFWRCNAIREMHLDGVRKGSDAAGCLSCRDAFWRGVTTASKNRLLVGLASGPRTLIHKSWFTGYRGPDLFRYFAINNKNKSTLLIDEYFNILL